MATVLCGTVQWRIIFLIIIFILHINVYYKDHLAHILQHRRGFFMSNPFED